MSDLKYLFGPVPSRRLGRSLGVNIIPSKICSMDCLYCEAGRTKALTVKRAPYISAAHILEEFADNYETLAPFTDIITVTGAGEPTLNYELDKILIGIKNIANDKPIAILTNSTLIGDIEVYDTLLKFDVVVPSLDSAIEAHFNAIDRKAPDVDMASVIEGLIKFSHEYKGKLFLEILLCKGVNDSIEDLDALIKVIKKMKAAKVQIGTVFRPPAYSEAVRLSDEELMNAAKYFMSHQIAAEATGVFKKIYDNIGLEGDLSGMVEALVQMRPCTFEDFLCVFGCNNEELTVAIDKLRKEKKSLHSVTHNGQKYYMK